MEEELAIGLCVATKQSEFNYGKLQSKKQQQELQPLLEVRVCHQQLW